MDFLETVALQLVVDYGPISALSLTALGIGIVAIRRMGAHEKECQRNRVLQTAHNATVIEKLSNIEDRQAEEVEGRRALHARINTLLERGL